MNHRVLRAVAAGGVLLLAVAGLPAALVIYGRSPLDGAGSIADQLSEVTTNAISDTVVFGVLSIVAWVFWALFTMTVATEAASALGRGTHWRPPASGLFQMSARRLVTAVTMTATLSGPLSERGGALPRLDATPIAAAVDAEGPRAASPLRAQPHSVMVQDELARATPPAEAGAAQRGEGLPSVSVVPGDSPWALAERHLGDGLRWREIWDLNRGATQPDGRVWVIEDLILPGWQLCMPADATGIHAPGPALPSAPAPPPERTHPPDSGPVLPGSAPTTTTTVAESPTTTVNPAPDMADGDDRTTDGDDETENVGFGELLGVAGTLMAAAVLRELRRRRTRRAVQLPVRALPQPPRRGPTSAELYDRADEITATRLDSAVAHLAESIRPRSGRPCAQPRVAQMRGGRVDLMLDRPDSSPPAPWRAEAAGLFWVLDEEHELPSLDGVSPMPTLVTIGRDDTDLLIDLEAFGLVALVGDPEACIRMARSIAVELCSRSEGVLGVEVVDDVLGAAADLVGVKQRASWADVDTAVVATSARLLDSGGWPHTWAARASGRIFDGWLPAIWISAPSIDQDYVEAVAAVAEHPGSGAAMLVVGGDPGHGLRIHLDAAGRYEIAELGLTGRAQGIAADTVGDINVLLAGADVPATEHLPVPATPIRLADDETASEPSGGFVELQYDVLIRLCGTIQVDGAETALTQREMAIAAFVALNGSADVDEVRAAVWNGADVSRKTVQNLVAAVRGKLPNVLDKGHDGRIVAADGLVTDIELIRRRLAHGETESDPATKIEVLRGALDLVTGLVCAHPHGGRRCWHWLVFGNWVAHVEALVATTASQLAHTGLALGDAGMACWAAQRGLDGVGRRDELVVLLAKGHELAGNNDAARSVVRAHEAYLADLGVDELNEDLLELLDRHAAPYHHKRP